MLLGLEEQNALINATGLRMWPPRPQTYVCDIKGRWFPPSIWGR